MPSFNCNLLKIGSNNSTKKIILAKYISLLIVIGSSKIKDDIPEFTGQAARPS